MSFTEKALASLSSDSAYLVLERQFSRIVKELLSLRLNVRIGKIFGFNHTGEFQSYGYEYSSTRTAY